MFRKHLSTIVFLTLAVATAVLYGLGLTVFGFVRHAPMWLTVGACVFTGVVIAVISDAVAQAVARRMDAKAGR